jgi:hypothetical protein
MIGRIGLVVAQWLSSSSALAGYVYGAASPVGDPRADLSGDGLRERERERQAP